MLIADRKVTKLQAGDRVRIDVDNHRIILLRDGKPIQKSNGEDDYSLMPSDGVEFDTLVELVADAAGLRAQQRGDDYILFDPQ
jgi:bifunctional DNA-binding transcriptional regulator/antitoxin component of YhaV-PrlF toxin-antitoxin module